jgi:DnaK suppressor protein
MFENNDRPNQPEKTNGSQGWKFVQEQLRAERDRLRSELASDSVSPDDLTDGWQDRDSASESSLRDVEFGHRSALRQRILQIDRALERIKEDTYGLCDWCQRRIDQTRLSLESGVQLCLACQSRIEAEAAASSK